MAAADDNNLLYCPHISKLTYLEGLNQYVTLRAQGSHRPTGYRESRLRSDDSHSSDRILGEYFASGNNWFPTPGEDVLPPYSSTVSDPSLTLQTIPVNLGPTITRLPVPRLKRKSSETFSDFGAPPKYARSLQSIHDSSFEIEVRRQRLLFSDVPSSPVAKTEVHGDTDLDPAHNLDSIIDALELMLPGIRLGERLRTLDSLTPQIVMDFLVENGILAYVSSGVNSSLFFFFDTRPPQHTYSRRSPVFRCRENQISTLCFLSQRVEPMRKRDLLYFQQAECFSSSHATRLYRDSPP